jgi:hypothetical protein
MFKFLDHADKRLSKKQRAALAAKEAARRAARKAAKAKKAGKKPKFVKPEMYTVKKAKKAAPKKVAPPPAPKGGPFIPVTIGNPATGASLL